MNKNMCAMAFNMTVFWFKQYRAIIKLYTHIKATSRTKHQIETYFQ